MIAAFFGVTVSDAAAVKLTPVAVAVTESLLNVLFMQHFQEVARGPLIVHRLERRFGAAIRGEYERLRKAPRRARRFSPL